MELQTDMLLPHKGFLLVELVHPEEGKIAMPDSAKEDSVYGKVLEIGKPAVRDGAVEDVPSFTIGSNEEGLGGVNHKLKKGDIIIFKRMTQHGITQYTTDTENAFVSFESVLGLKLPDEEVKK